MDSQHIVELTDFMDSHYGVGNWTRRTGVGLGTDIGPALVAACNFLRTNYGRGIISITPGGAWLMNTAPTPAQWSGHRIIGAGSQASSVVWNSNSGCPFYFNAAGGYTGGGIEGLSILLEDGYPTSNTYGILLQGDASFQQDQTMWSDIYMTALGNSYWFNGFQAYGNARTSPQGIRIADMTNVQIFRCRNAGFYGSNLVGWSGRNIGCYAGLAGGNSFYLTGGGSTNTNSVQCHFDLVIASIVASNLSLCKINGVQY